MGISKFKKPILFVFGTIVLGAIGSGLWDWVLSDLLSWIGNTLVTLFGSLSNSYRDMVYNEINKGPLYPLIAQPFFFWFMAIVTALLVGVMRLYMRIKSLKEKLTGADEETDKSIDERIEEISRHFKRRLLPLIGIFFVFMLLQGWQAIYKHKAALFIETSIEILAPYIDTNEILMLKSKYRQIDNSSRYYELVEILIKHASKSQISLSKFDPI